MLAESALTLQIAIGLIFLMSAWGKARDLPTYLAGLSEYRLLSESLLRLAGMTVLAFEVLLAWAHLSGVRLQLFAPLSVALLTTFAIVVGIVLHRGRPVPCLCFGARSGENVTGVTLARVLVIAAAECALWVLVSNRDISLETVTPRNAAFCIAFAIVALGALSWMARIPEVLAASNEVWPQPQDR